MQKYDNVFNSASDCFHTCDHAPLLSFPLRQHLNFSSLQQIFYGTHQKPLFTFTTTIRAPFNGLAWEIYYCSILSHTVTLKYCVGKLNAVGISFSILSPQSYLVNLFTLQPFTICIINFHLLLCVPHQTMSSWGAGTLFFSVNINIYVEQNLTGHRMTLPPFLTKSIKLICCLHLFCFSACFTIIYNFPSCVIKPSHLW